MSEKVQGVSIEVDIVFKNEEVLKGIENIKKNIQQIQNSLLVMGKIGKSVFSNISHSINEADISLKSFINNFLSLIKIISDKNVFVNFLLMAGAIKLLSLSMNSLNEEIDKIFKNINDIIENTLNKLKELIKELQVTLKFEMNLKIELEIKRIFQMEVTYLCECCCCCCDSEKDSDNKKS